MICSDASKGLQMYDHLLESCSSFGMRDNWSRQPKSTIAQESHCGDVLAWNGRLRDLVMMSKLPKRS